MSRVLPGKYCKILIENLNDLKGSANLPLLAQKLQISQEAVSSINSIKLDPVQDTIAIDKNDTSMSIFTIELILNNMGYIDSAQKESFITSRIFLM
ncbi:hypothetical protein [Paraflavitalea speifideaquila]|uniref:hypothetical protein n=1 Tax=Paraflavitalea speifideaquila TaxID=3076558 RepID=UPI0028E2AAA8|nr:hypothetical protein [Paraflavitalea speifideiaquila]